jgi:hypothetical protein
VLSDTKLLRNHFEEVHPRQTENEEGDVEDCDAVRHFRGEACERVRTFIHRAVGKQQIKQAVEGESGPNGESHGQLSGVLEERDAESGSHQIGPDGNQVPDDIGSATAAQEHLQQHGQSDLREYPPELHYDDDVETDLLEEGVLQVKIPIEVEDEVGEDADGEVVEEVDGPVVHHAHPVHPHHLDQPLLLL